MRKFSVVLMLVLLLSSCFAAGLGGGGEESLKKTASLYYNLLMWKYYDRASAFVDVEKRDKFQRFVSESEDTLNITSYELKHVALEEDGNESSVSVIINYYKYPSVSEKSFTLEDAWIRKKGSWYVSSDFDDGIFK